MAVKSALHTESCCRY